MSTTPQQDIATRIQEYLDQHQPDGFRLNVVQDGIRQDGDWWYVTVVPNPVSVRSHEYAERLAAIEEQLCDEQSLNVLLVPTLAGG